MTPYYERAGVTIYHGETLSVLRDLDVSVGAVLADPPYSSGGLFRSDRQADTTEKYRGWSQAPGGGSKSPASVVGGFSGDGRDQRSYGYWSALWLSEALRLAVPGGLCFVFTDWRQFPTASDALQAGGWVWRGAVTWDKGIARPVKGRFRVTTEYALWGSNGPLPAHRDAYPDALIAAAPPSTDEREHVTQKPVELYQHLLSIVPAGSVVLDPFMGSGSALVAAKRLGHPAVGIEIKERYCEIAARRLSQDVLPLFEEAAG